LRQVERVVHAAAQWQRGALAWRSEQTWAARHKLLDMAWCDTTCSELCAMSHAVPLKPKSSHDACESCRSAPLIVAIVRRAPAACAHVCAHPYVHVYALIFVHDYGHSYTRSYADTRMDNRPYAHPYAHLNAHIDARPWSCHDMTRTTGVAQRMISIAHTAQLGTVCAHRTTRPGATQTCGTDLERRNPHIVARLVRHHSSDDTHGGNDLCNRLCSSTSRTVMAQHGTTRTARPPNEARHSHNMVRPSAIRLTPNDLA
jgi:hypothetical protein